MNKYRSIEFNLLNTDFVCYPSLDKPKNSVQFQVSTEEKP
jgi:hypothetical protein